MTSLNPSFFKHDAESDCLGYASSEGALGDGAGDGDGDCKGFGVTHADDGTGNTEIFVGGDSGFAKYSPYILKK